MSFKSIFKNVSVHATSKRDELEELLSLGHYPVVIFGAGSVGEAVAQLLIDKGIKISAFCDNHKFGLLDRFNVPIINVSTLISDFLDAVLIICVGPLHSDLIKSQVISAGFPNEMIFQRYNAWHYFNEREFRENYYDGYEWAYYYFSDPWSREIIINRIKGYLGHCLLPSISYEKQYFEERFITFNDHEVFYDIGGFTGDTSESFARYTNGKFRHIYFFEPDEENLLQAKKRLKNISNITWINKGLWSCESELSFVSDGGSSRFNLSGDKKISVVSLDSFVLNNRLNIAPSFIKMDIEGAELCALKGASQIIERYTPKLAVCVYHKPQDIYELPQAVLKCSAYKMALSHYTPGMNETVLYAIPNW